VILLLLVVRPRRHIISLIYDSLICQKDTEKTELSERCSKYHNACGIILHLLYCTTLLQHNQYHTGSKYPCLFFTCKFVQIVVSNISKCAYLRVEGVYIISYNITRIFGFPQLQNAKLYLSTNALVKRNGQQQHCHPSHQPLKNTLLVKTLE